MYFFHFCPDFSERNMADEVGSLQSVPGSSSPFSLAEVTALSDVDLIEKFSLISKNKSIKSKITNEYQCKILGDSCNAVFCGRRANQDMKRHLRQHLNELQQKDTKQRQNSQNELGRKFF